MIHKMVPPPCPAWQVDNHNPNLTVRETLDFAHACQMGLHGAPFDVPAELAAARRLETQQHVGQQQQHPQQQNGRNGAAAGGGGPVAEGHGGHAGGQHAAAGVDAAAAAAAVAPSGGSHNGQGQGQGGGGQGQGQGGTAGSFVKSVLSARLNHHNHHEHLLEVREQGGKRGEESLGSAMWYHIRPIAYAT